MKKVAITIIFIGMLMSSCSQRGPEKAEYSGEELNNEFTIKRSKFDKKAVLKSESNEQWRLYAGPSVEKIDMSKPIAKGNEVGVTPLPVPDNQRWYFQIVTDKGNAIMAEKQLPMQGGHNFRDLGGIRAGDGRHVKWGMMLRSDELGNLTSSDLVYLSSIPVHTIVDFRSREEIAQSPDNVPSSVENVYQLSVSPGNLMEMSGSMETMCVPMADNIMKMMNEMIVTDSSSVEQYRRFFELASDESNAPILFHCTAGKDRTGMAAALFLSALGADFDTIMQDYMLSNVYLESKYADIKSKSPALAVFFTVKPEFLKAGFDRIEEHYGSVDNYLTDILGVDKEKLRSIYLYDN